MTTSVEVPETLHIEPVAQPNPTPIERETPEGTEPLERVREPSQRELAMEQIALRRREAIEKELRYGEEMADQAREDSGLEKLHRTARARPAEYDETEGNPAETEPGAAEPAVEATPAAQPVAQPAQPAAPAAPGAQPKYHVVTVGNQQYQVTEEQLAHLASVGAVALDAMQRQQGQPQAPVQPQPQQPAQPQQQAPRQAPRQAILTPEESRALSSRLQYGNEAESAAALHDMTNLIAARLQAANPQIDPQRLANYAIQQATAQIRQENVLNNNLAIIGSEYPEVFASNTIAQLAALKLHENRQRDRLLGAQKSDLDAYREACQMVTAELNLRPEPAPQPNPSQTQSALSQAGQNQPAGLRPAGSRFEAKRAAPRSPQPAQRVLAAEQQGGRYATPSEIVQAMKKSRGQAF